MVPISRFIATSTKCQSGCREILSHLRRWDPVSGARTCSYSNSSRGSDRPRILPSETSVVPRSWGTFLFPAAIFGFAGIAAFFHYNDERRAVPKGEGNRSSYTTSAPIIGGPFTLVNTENQIVTEKNLLDNWVLLYFGSTSSPDVGPEQVRVLAQAIDMLESKQNCKILPVFVTIDPQRDTPSHLRAYLKEFDARIVGLTGAVAAVRQMAQEYRVYFKKVEEEGGDYLVDSSHNIYLLGPNMEVVRCFGIEYNAEELSHAILKELNRAASS